MNLTQKEPDVARLAERLDRLEKENKRLKQVVLTIALIGVSLVTMAQVRSTPKVVEAERFVLKDSSGKEKAYLGNGQFGPELKLDEVNANRAAFTSISAGGMNMFTTGQGKDATMIMGPGGVFFTTDGKDGQQRVSIHTGGPAIEIIDKQGFQTTIGAANLETVNTGESRRTSAASIVIFDKEKNVIWKAPAR